MANGSSAQSLPDNSTSVSNELKNNSTDSTLPVLSRKKRYLAFPVGSSFSIAFCETIGVIGNPKNIYLSWSLNWGVAYDLPNQTWILNQDNAKKPMPKPILQRRYRRDLYSKLETAIDNMGYPGKSCILRALCESTQYFGKRKTNMVEELLKTVFSLPYSKVLPFEHSDIVEYDSAHRKGRKKVSCEEAYPTCYFSLLQLALGDYSNMLNLMNYMK